MIPSDVNIRFSFLNTKLRDQYRSLEDLCDDLDEDMSAILASMESAGYIYDRGANRFVAK